METKEKIKKRAIRHRRVRAKIFGTASRPRISVFRSNRRMTVQIIDDESRKSLLQMIGTDPSDLGNKVAKEALQKKIKKAVFDKGGYAYHGRVMALAEGLRKGGLII